MAKKTLLAYFIDKHISCEMKGADFPVGIDTENDFTIHDGLFLPTGIDTNDSLLTARRRNCGGSYDGWSFRSRVCMEKMA